MQVRGRRKAHRAPYVNDGSISRQGNRRARAITGRYGTVVSVAFIEATVLIEIKGRVLGSGAEVGVYSGSPVFVAICARVGGRSDCSEQKPIAANQHAVDHHFTLLGRADLQVEIPAPLVHLILLLLLGRGGAVDIPGDGVLGYVTYRPSGGTAVLLIKGGYSLLLNGLSLQIITCQIQRSSRLGVLSFGQTIPDAVDTVGFGGIGCGVGSLEVLTGAEKHNITAHCRVAYQRGSSCDRLCPGGVLCPRVGRCIQRVAAVRYFEVRAGYAGLYGARERIRDAVVIDRCDEIEAPQVALQVSSVCVVYKTVSVIIRTPYTWEAVSAIDTCVHYDFLAQGTVLDINDQQRRDIIVTIVSVTLKECPLTAVQPYDFRFWEGVAEVFIALCLGIDFP